MSITHVNTQSDSGTANTGTTTVTKPTGLQVDDLMLAFICMNDDAAATGPSGWTKYDDDVDTTNHFRSQVWYKVATSTETAATDFSWTTTAGATSPMWGAISAYRGVDTAAPINTAANSSFTTSTNPVTGPSITTTATSTIVHYRQVRLSGSTTIPTYTGSGNQRFQAGNHGASTSYSGTSFDSGSDTAAGTITGISITCSSTPSTALSRTIALKTFAPPATNASAGVAAVTASALTPTLALAAAPAAGAAAATVSTKTPVVAVGVNAGVATSVVSVKQVTVATTPFTNASAGIAQVTVTGQPTRMDYAPAGSASAAVSVKAPLTSVGNQAGTAQVLTAALRPALGFGVSAGVAQATAAGGLAGPGLGTAIDIAAASGMAYPCTLYFGSTRTLMVGADNRAIFVPWEERTLMVEES